MNDARIATREQAKARCPRTELRGHDVEVTHGSAEGRCLGAVDASSHSASIHVRPNHAILKWREGGLWFTDPGAVRVDGAVG